MTHGYQDMVTKLIQQEDTTIKYNRHHVRHLPSHLGRNIFVIYNNSAPPKNLPTFPNPCQESPSDFVIRTQGTVCKQNTQAIASTHH